MVKLLHFDYTALALYLLMTFALLFRTRKSSGRRSMFSAVLFVALFSTIYDICAVLLDNSGKGGVALKYIVHAGYLILRNLITPMMVGYVISVADTWHTLYKKKFLQALFWVPFSLVALLTLSSPITHIVFYIDEYDMYARGPYFIVLYMSAIYYTAYALYYAIKNIKVLTLEKFIPLVSIVPFQLIAIIIQFIFPNILCEMVTTALSLLSIMITIERPEEKFDTNTGLLKRSVFMDMLVQAKKVNKPLCIVLLNVTNYSALNSYMSYSNMESISAAIGRKLESVKKQLQLSPDLYDLESGLFAAVLFYDEIPYGPRYASHLLESFILDYRYNELPISTFPNACVINLPDDTDDIETIRLITKDFRAEKYSGELFLASNIMKHKDYTITANMDAIISNAIENDQFEVYYQPIYSNIDGHFNSAEALIRLNTKEYGFIRPDLFIPIAEETGAIHDIGMIVLEKVCKFIASDEYKELGLDYIEVNLSVVQCMDQDLVKKVENICKKYNIDSSQINLEVTETATSFSQKQIVSNIVSLHDNGYQFSLDDFGTGYSNVVRIAFLPLHIVKLDRSFTWAESNDDFKPIVEKTITMLKKMNMRIVVEGVETEDMLTRFRDYGCEYIQGYYFSKPLPKYDFIKFIQDSKKPAV
ncbi:MAG: EAL domain-containing protein [Lachnospiraceae bacterium]|nr:EAL domain-containing protein [Lachnospiraceae bacterium]